jgi:phospholipid transport system substrate-binding protein
LHRTFNVEEVSLRMVRLAGALAIVALALGASAPVSAATPTETLKSYGDVVLKILEDPALKSPDRKHERRAAVRKVAEEIFDIGETAKRALGPHWQARTPAEREEFTQLFADLLESTYIARIDEYGGERIRYTGEKIDGDTAVVQSRVLTKKGSEAPVEARLLRRGDKWQIYDVTIEGVSLISNYRTQFDRIIRTSSYPELVKRLRAHGRSGTSAEPRSTR